MIPKASLNFALPLLGVLIALGAAELIGRAFFMQQSLDSHRFYSSDPTLGWTYAKGASMSATNTFGESVALTFTKAGFRDWQPLKARRDSTRILYLGDSVTGALQVNQTDHFIQLIDHAFNAQGMHTAGFNYGVNGYSTDQELLVLDHVIDSINPALVIYTFVDNDLDVLDLASFIINRVDYGKPRASIAPDGSVTIAPPPFLKHTLGTNLRERFMQTTFIGSHLRSLWRKLRSLQGLGRTADNFEAINSHIDWEELAKKRKVDGISAERWRLFEALIVAMKNHAEKHGARFVIFPFFDPWQTLPRARAAIEQRGADPDFLTKRVIEIARRKQIDVIADTAYAIKNVDDIQRSQFFFVRNSAIYDGHLTREGHRFTAKFLAPRISDLLIPEAVKH